MSPREVANFQGTVPSAQVITPISEYGHQHAHRPDHFAIVHRRADVRGGETRLEAGTLVSVETITSEKGERRYECVVSDITWSYTVQYEHPIKAAVHGPVKFVIEKDTMIILDPDDKERSAHIEKRERVLLDSPDRLLPPPRK
jgi:hypothetical protein